MTEKYAEGTEGKNSRFVLFFHELGQENADRINPNKADLAKIDAIKTVADLQNIW